MEVAAVGWLCILFLRIWRWKSVIDAYRLGTVGLWVGSYRVFLTQVLLNGSNVMVAAGKSCKSSGGS